MNESAMHLSKISIPGYQIRRELGQGGMANVYLAIQISLERKVAIKVLSGDLVSDTEFCQRFLKEGKVLAQVQHTNVVPIYDSGEHNGIYYMCMEYIPGGTLEDRLKQNSLSLNESIGILKQIASALEWSHGKGLIHRDVKPANVLFRDDNTPVLSDFGIAKATRQNATKMTTVGMAIGTPSYMSPEQASAREITSKSDQYSLGVLFYELLTGQVPYKADTALAVAIQHIQEPIPSLPDRYSHLQFIIDRMLAKKPSERFNTLQELVVTLEKGIAGTSSNDKTEIIQVSNDIDLVKSSSTNSKSRLLVSAGIVSVVLLLGILYFFTNKTDIETTENTNPGLETAIPTPTLDPVTVQKITNLLDIADTHHSIGRLVEPRGSNALEAYSKVLELDSTNITAVKGISNISASLASMARERLDQGDIEESKLLVTQALMAEPENKDLLQLQKQLEK